MMRRVTVNRRRNLWFVVLMTLFIIFSVWVLSIAVDDSDDSAMPGMRQENKEYSGGC